jgi:hypothetical protein
VGGSLKEAGDRAEPLRVKQSSPQLVDAPAPASAGPQSGKSPRRSVGKAWLFVAISGAILVGVALLYLSVWGFAEPNRNRGTAPAVKADGKARMTMVAYAAGAGVTYRAPDHAFAIALPGVPEDTSVSKHVHRLASSWSESSYVEVHDGDGLAPSGTPAALKAWLRLLSKRMVVDAHGTLTHDASGALPSGEPYHDVTFSYERGGRTSVSANRLVPKGRHLYILTLVDAREHERAFARLARSFRLGPTPDQAKNATAEDKTGAFGVFNSLERVHEWTSGGGAVTLELPRKPTVKRGQDSSSLWEDAFSKPDGQHSVEVVVTTYADKLANDAAELKWARDYQSQVVAGRKGTLRSSKAAHLETGQVYLDFVMEYESSGVVYRRGRIVVDGYRSVLVYVDDAIGDAPATFAHVVDSMVLEHN